MGILSRLTSSASMGLNLSTMVAKTVSLATFSALEGTLQTTREFSEFAFGSVDEILPVVDEVS